MHIWSEIIKYVLLYYIIRDQIIRNRPDKYFLSGTTLKKIVAIIKSIIEFYCMPSHNGGDGEFHNRENLYCYIRYATLLYIVDEFR